jgi:hypothetical protein
MTKESVWDSNAWKTVIALSIILGIIVSILGILDWLGKIDIKTPITSFFNSEISILNLSIAVIAIIALVIVTVCLLKKRKRGCILDDDRDARRIAILCQTPRTTAYLRQQYNYWQSQYQFGSGGFDDVMKTLEKQRFLTFNKPNGTWQVTQKALDYIAKYHGD